MSTAQIADLAPSERACLSERAVEKRRRDFAGGRLAAKAALQIIDRVQPILSGKDRAPIWPDGVVGTLTHSGQDAYAAVALDTECGGLGLDLEHASSVRRLDIAKMIADDTERAWIGQDRRRLAALFSAKEAVYKALYPRYGRYFGFEAVTCRWHPDLAHFKVTLRQDLGPGYPTGSVVTVDVIHRADAVLTALWLPPG